MSNTNLIKQAIVNTTSPIQLLKQFRMGFELEFQALDGNTKNDLEGELDTDDIDSDALREDAQEALSNQSDEDYIACLPRYGTNTGVNNLVSIIKRLLKEHISWSDIKDFPEFSNIVQDTEDSMLEGIEQDLLENDPERYYGRMPGRYDIDLGNLPMELGDDGSVKGGEIRTRGGLTVTQFFKCLKQLQAYDFTIDEGCSFHIHLSVPNVKHVYGREFQAEVMGYILNNYQRLPERVRERLDSEAKRWALPKVSTEKYTMVHFHETQNTWEFRLFGNIVNPHDAYQCLLLACEAMRHAYAVQLDWTINRKDEVFIYNRIRKADANFEQLGTQVYYGEASSLDQLIRLHAQERKTKQAAA